MSDEGFLISANFVVRCNRCDAAEGVWWRYFCGGPETFDLGRFV